MAKKISGIAQAVTGFTISKGPSHSEMIEFYPLGRQMRGFLGYLALEAGLRIADKFPDWSWDGVIFRDLLPLSRCGRNYIMEIDGRFLPCAECGDDYTARMIRKVRTRILNYKEVREGRKYRLEIVVQDEEYLEDIILLMRAVEKTGLRLGKMTSSGHGLFVMREWNVSEAAPQSGEKWMLISDAVLPEGKESTIGKTVGSSFEIVRIKTVPKGFIMTTKLDGFAIGSYTGLGFGEVAPAQEGSSGQATGT